MATFVDEIRALFRETDRQFKETDRKFAETDPKFRENSREINALRDLFTSQWGRPMESLVVEVKMTLRPLDGIAPHR